MHVEMRGQLFEIISLFLPLCGVVVNLGCQFDTRREREVPMRDCLYQIGWPMGISVFLLAN